MGQKISKFLSANLVGGGGVQAKLVKSQRFYFVLTLTLSI